MALTTVQRLSKLESDVVAVNSSLVYLLARLLVIENELKKTIRIENDT